MRLLMNILGRRPSESKRGWSVWKEQSEQGEVITQQDRRGARSLGERITWGLKGFVGGRGVRTFSYRVSHLTDLYREGMRFPHLRLFHGLN